MFTTNFFAGNEHNEGAAPDTAILRLNCNGTDTSTTFTDEGILELGNGTVTGNVQVDTSWSKFGTGSLQNDGTNGACRWAYNSEFEIMADTTQDYTISLFFKLNVTTGQQTFYTHTINATHYIILFYEANDLDFQVYSATAGGMQVRMVTTSNPISDTNEHHVAVVKKANGSDSDWGLYIDGQQVGNSITNSNTYTFGEGEIALASWYPRNLFFLNGRMDAIRVYKGNPFNAAPNSGNTDTITVPTTESF